MRKEQFTQISGLARAVRDEGDLVSAGVMLDVLGEMGDHDRAAELAVQLGDLMAASARLTDEAWAAARKFRTAEQSVYRLDEARQRLWASFAGAFGRLFFVELNGRPDLEDLRRVASTIQSAKQAARLAVESTSEDEDSSEGGVEEGPVGMNEVPVSVAGSFVSSADEEIAQ